MSREAISLQIQAIVAQFNALMMMLAEEDQHLVVIADDQKECEHLEVVNLSAFGAPRAQCKICGKLFLGDEAKMRIAAQMQGGR